MIARRDLLIGGIYLAGAATAFARLPDRRRPRLARGVLEQWVPATIGPWHHASNEGVVLPTADELSDRLYDNIVSRTYAAAGVPPVMLMLAYNSEQDGVLQIHRPEACYKAGGFGLTPTQTVPLEVAPGRSLDANRFAATAPDRVEQVLYWTREGDRIPSSWLGQKRDLLLANLAREVPDGMLVRVSTFAEGAAAGPVLETFVRSLVAAAPARLRGLLVGPLA